MVKTRVQYSLERVKRYTVDHGNDNGTLVRTLSGDQGPPSTLLPRLDGDSTVGLRLDAVERGSGWDSSSRPVDSGRFYSTGEWFGVRTLGRVVSRWVGGSVPVRSR